VAGDFSDFEGTQVSLFYFTDVPRLMQILNPSTYEVGGLKGASEQAANERRKLSEAELALVDAQGDVNTAQTRVVALRERLRQTQAASDAAKKIFRSSTLGVQEADRDFNRTTEQFNKAKTAADAAPDDPAKRAAYERLAQARDQDEARLREARERNEEIDEERKAVEAERAKLQADQRGLPNDIQQAEIRLEAAQAAVNRLRKSAILSAQAESEAFVRSRDNRPYWYSPAIGSSTDPAKRVLMWAFNDSKTIFLRGKKADLDEVKEIIAEFDRPAPQARMTLWTLELSSKASESGVKRFNKGLEMVNNHLSGSRAYIAAAHSLLRDCINDEVGAVAEAQYAQLPNRTPQNANDYYLARVHFYHPEVLHRLKFDPVKVSQRLGTETTLKAAEIDIHIAQWMIPDPAGTTTLGEALMVLSLGKQEHRVRIMRRFTNQLPIYLNGLGLTDAPAIQNTSIWFSSLKRALGVDEPQIAAGQDSDQRAQLRRAGLTDAQIARLNNGSDGLNSKQLETVRSLVAGSLKPEQVESLLNALSTGGSAGVARNARSGGLTAAQLEITHALVQLSSQRLTRYVRERSARLGDVNARLNLLDTQISNTPRPQSDDDSSEALQRLGRTRLRLRAERELVALELLLAARRLKDRLGLSFDELLETVDEEDRALAMTDANKKQVELEKIAQDREQKINTATVVNNFRNTLAQLSQTNPLRTANARVAAADQMLKEIIIAMEDDLDRHFIQPMLRDLRVRLTNSGVGVGIIQRTSVLATNRLVARVDPRASGQLPLGSEVDILEATQQIAQIYLASQTAGVLGALGSLNALPRKPEGELYGLTTGNVFQVTPIFDPSGQALRFKFDHVGTSQIREPDGTVNPQLPRIERHTVNTEVQLTNMELREVSRFNSNARLGLATQYSGGLPIIKDIPYLRRVPLFGWFVRRGGSNAVTQESLIFGQTTMYPTIGDIVDLLTVPPGTAQ
jgi:hypothetical protein